MPKHLLTKLQIHTRKLIKPDKARTTAEYFNIPLLILGEINTEHKKKWARLITSLFGLITIYRTLLSTKAKKTKYLLR